jgi:nitrogen fixation/metabolism regulation signal transduction histidine kinase
MSSLLPEGFDRDAEALTAALDAWGQFDRLKGTVGASLSLFWLFLSGPLMLLALLTGLALSERIVRPLVQLGEATRKIAEGDFSFRVLGREDEVLSFLTMSFNRMIGELEVSRVKILQTEKVAAWQEIAQRLAHELRNPLTPIKLSVQRLIRKSADNTLDMETVREVLNLVLREVDGLDSLLQDFRDFAGSGTPQKERVRIRALLEEATLRFRSILPEVDWQTVGGNDDPDIDVDPRQIRQVLVNLLNNAAEAGADEVAVRLDLVTKGSVPYARFQVRDNGEGIPDERIDKVFQPYVTTKNRGSGLGLAVVQRIIYDHRGRIWFESEPGSGTVFYVDLPAEGET